MKKLTLTLCALAVAVSGAFAGTETYSGKGSKSTMQAPCPTWYADNEWTVGISGIYAPTADEWENDRYLGVDHGWGAGVDIKYFFRRYMGVGVQAFGLAIDQSSDEDLFNDDDDNDFAGGLLGTFTFRYPIPCSRFAPYGWVGVGAVFGAGTDQDDAFLFADDDDDDDSRLMGQYGLGFEVRFTQNIGLTNDVSFNHVDGSQNDFWQFRTGLNFAF